MKKLHILYAFAAAAFLLTACDTDVEHDIAQVDAPVFVSATPETGSTVKTGNVTITLQYDKNIYFASEDASQISISDNGTVVSADVIGVSNTLTIVANCPNRGATYTLTVPAGLVTGPNQMPAPEVSLTLSTTGLNTTPVNSLTAEAQQVYDFLVENFETRTLSATMAVDGVSGQTGSWNTADAEQVYQWTGQYPAMNCFDYLHLAASPSNWIDYSDITPVKSWWNNGGIVLAMWHWNVPKAEGDTDTNNYTSTLSETAFNIDNAFTEGTWEYNTVHADLAKIAGYLRLLHDANIPVIWRPLHEAAGGWFWWGKNADSFKKLWVEMFDYFETQGLNNLIWVWTSETNDTDWYPGDEYVDIIGRDLYGNDAVDCAAQYRILTNDFGNKMITLSECGYSEYTDSTVGLLSEQWNAGARWLWFMPWYDSAESTSFHADEAWWQDAMNQDYVVSRDELPDFR